MILLRIERVGRQRAEVPHPRAVPYIRPHRGGRGQLLDVYGLRAGEPLRARGWRHRGLHHRLHGGEELEGSCPARERYLESDWDSEVVDFSIEQQTDGGNRPASRNKFASLPLMAIKAPHALVVDSGRLQSERFGGHPERAQVALDARTEMWRQNLSTPDLMLEGLSWKTRTTYLFN